jgi:hypothetical protein
MILRGLNMPDGLFGPFFSCDRETIIVYLKILKIAVTSFEIKLPPLFNENNLKNISYLSKLLGNIAESYKQKKYENIKSPIYRGIE